MTEVTIVNLKKRKGKKTIFDTTVKKYQSLTDKSFGRSQNTNVIVAKALKHGAGAILDQIVPSELSYGDFTSAGDFQSCMNRTSKAMSDFNSLDAHIRKEFGNDPANLIHFINNIDDNTAQKARDLQLVPADFRTENEMIAAKAAYDAEKARLASIEADKPAQ